MSNFTKGVKRAVTYVVAGTTIAWSVGFLGLPVAFGAAATGDLIKTKCAVGAGLDDPCRAVYYFGADGKRYVFPNQKTYNTWYTSFSGVKEVSKTEMESYLIGGNATYRPGVKMLKVPSDPRVYAVKKDGELWHVASEAVAQALYGTNWSKQVNDERDTVFASYPVALEAGGPPYVVKKINAASEYDKAALMAGSPDISTDKGLTTGGIVTPPGGPAGSTLTVALASDTPASAIVVENSQRVSFTVVNFTASADGDATIDSMVIIRGGGASQDAAFAGIQLWDGDTDSRISNTARTLSSDHTATFNEDIVVKAGTTRKVIIAGNMAASLDSYAGEVPTLGVSSITMTGSTTLVGASLPLYGNYQTLNGSVTIGSLTVAAGANNPSSSTQKIGTTDFIFTGLRITAGSTEKVEITRLVFNQGGTAADADIQNLELLVDSSPVATVKQASSKDVAFDLRANPLVIDKGKSKQVDLRGDLVTGSSRTVRWDIKKQDDLIAKGLTYGFSPTPTYPNASEPYFNTGATITISRGTVQVTATPGVTNSNIAEDTKEVTLGKFDFDVRGESLSFESVALALKLTTTTDSAIATDITNVKLVDSTGKVLGGPLDPTRKITLWAAAYDFDYAVATITDNFILPAGVHTITVKGDLNADFSANDTIRVRIAPPAMTIKGVDTGETLVVADKTPAGEQTSAIFTVKTASLAASVLNIPVAQNVVGGTQSYEFANIRLDATDSGEDIKLTQMKVEMFTATAAPNLFTNWQIVDGTTALQTSTSPDPTGTSAGGATSTFVFVNPLVVTKGTVKTIKVVANVGTSATSGSIRVGLPTPHATGLQLSSTGKTSGQTATVTLSVSDGQTMTLQSSGTLTVTALTQSHQDGLLPANANGLEVGIFRMTAVRESVKVEKVYLSATSTRNLKIDEKNAFNQVKAIHLYDGSTRLTPEAGISPTTTALGGMRTVLIDLTSAPIIVPVTGAKDILVKVDTNAVTRYPQASTGDPGQGFQFSVNAALDVVAKGAQSGATLGATAITLSGATLSTFAVWSSVPTVTVNGDLGTDKFVPGTLAAGSDKELYRFKVAADSAGDIYLFQVGFMVSQQKATLTNPKLKIDGTQYAATTSVDVLAMTNTGARRDSVFHLWFTSDGAVPTATTISPYRIAAGGSKTIKLYGDVACWADAGCGASSGNGTLEFSFLGDTQFPPTSTNNVTYPNGATAGAVASGVVGGLYQLSGQNQNRFIWSDFSVSGPLGVASGTSTSTEQWTNGYRVKSGAGATSRLNATTTDVTFTYP